MNKIYKVVWSKAKNCYVVVSELAKSHTKSSFCSVRSQTLFVGVLCTFLSFCSFVLPAYANTGFVGSMISQYVQPNTFTGSYDYISSYPTYDSYQSKLATNYSSSYSNFRTTVSDVRDLITKFEKSSDCNSDYLPYCNNILNADSYSVFKSNLYTLVYKLSGYAPLANHIYTYYGGPLSDLYSDLNNNYESVRSVVDKIGGSAVSEDDLFFDRVVLDYSIALSKYQRNLNSYNNLPKAFGENSTAIGKSSVVNTGATDSFIVGNDSVSNAEGGLVFGSNSTLEATAENSVALGNNVIVSGKNSVALGSGSTATEDDVVSVGSNTLKRRIINVADGVDNTDVVTVGQLNTVLSNVGALSNTGTHYVGINSASGGNNEFGSGATGTNAIAIGYGASAPIQDATNAPNGSYFDNIAIGTNSYAQGSAVSVGSESKAEYQSVAVGLKSLSTINGVALGNNARSNGDVSIGYNSISGKPRSIALGNNARSYGDISIGRNSVSDRPYSIAIGNDTWVHSYAATALGHQASVISNPVLDSAINSISLGSYSSTDVDNVLSVGHKVGDYYYTYIDTSDAYRRVDYTDELKRRIINVADGIDDSDVTTIGQLNTEIMARSTADTALDERIGILSANGNYIRQSDTNDVTTNLLVLDNQLKVTNDNITGFASDITRNKNNIRSLNTSVTAALSSVSSTSSLVDTLNNTKADTSLNNLTETGRQVIVNAAVSAVQEYMTSQVNNIANPVAPIMYSSNPNILNVTDAGNGSLFVGTGSNVNGSSSIAIGVGNQVNANNAGAFGDPSIINADDSYVLGNDDTVNTGAVGSFIVGNDSVSNAKGSLLFGSDSKTEATAENSVGLGNNVTVAGKGSVALGYQSTATEDNVVSVGNDTLKRRITNVADGNLSADSTDAVTGKQLYATNEKVEANTLAIAQKADIDASNIDTTAWTEKLGTGKVQENDSNLVTGGTVFNAITAVEQNSPVKATNEAIFIGANQTDNLISVYNQNGEGRVITGVVTNPEDATSATNVGYVNAVATNMLENINGRFSETDRRMNKVGANAAALASLTPASFEGDEKWSLVASVGHYKGETAGAVGAFYRPAENVMLNVRGAVGNGENMMGAGVAVSLTKGDIPGVTKRQLAKEVISLKQNQQAMMQDREQDKQVIVEYQQKVAEQGEQIAKQNKQIANQEQQIKELIKRLEAVEKR